MWQQLTIQTRAAEAAGLEAMLQEHGTHSVTYLDAEDQPVFQEEPGSTPLWDAVVLLALFPADESLDALLFLLRNHPAVLNADTLAPEMLEDKDWERSWMDGFDPMRFGRRLWICPSWQEPPTTPGAVTLMLDPGLAFGSGTHNTTAMCLRWLDRAELTGRTVIDYGCGSGVLAIAAVLLGAASVHGVDNDPQAILATRDNARRNDLAPGALRAWLPEEVPGLQADILLANILAEPLRQLAPRFASLLRPGGALVLSGLLADQIDEVSRAYRDWIDFDTPVVDADWACLTGVRSR
ncbi:MAG: 50S ribosomal protein L11 methyltransferase [Pseudohongiellaceae bacterium]